MDTPKPLRILHLTDLHFREAVPGTSEIATRRSRVIGELLDALDAQMDAIAPDFIAITGDLLHAPYGLYRGTNPFGMERFTEDVLADYRSLKRRFDNWDIPYLALPGNHDSMALMSEVFDGPHEIEVNGYRIIAFHDREHAGNVPYRVDDELRRYRDCLTDNDPRPQIHLQHYVAHPIVEHPYPHNYGDRAGLLDLLADSKVVLSLSGHFHPGHEPIEKDGVTHIVGRAVCEAPHPVGLIDIDSNGVVSHHELHLGRKPVPSAIVVDRDTLLEAAGSPSEASAFSPTAQLLLNRNDTLIVLTSDLAHADLIDRGWPELADWHDTLYATLAQSGVVIDALYYTTHLSGSERSAAGIPRIALGCDEDLLERVKKDLGTTDLHSI